VQRIHQRSSFVLSALAVLATACGDPAPGSLEIRVYGESFIEDGIPAGEVVDGWAIDFDRFLIALSDVQAAQGSSPPALSAPQQTVFDVSLSTMMAGALVASAEVPAGRYDTVSYRIAPARTGAVAGPSVPADAVQAMIAAGESVRVAGTASKAGRSIRFDWRFDEAVRYHTCRSTAEIDGGTGQAQLTIHGDHLFYDDIVAEEPNVAFELIAATDADGDGVVTRAELQVKDLGAEARYQVGSTGVTNLWDFIAYQTGTLGHIDGEGHCETAPE